MVRYYSLLKVVLSLEHRAFKCVIFFYSLMKQARVWATIHHGQ